VRRHLANPPRLVLGLQPGVPFSSGSYAHQLATAVGLAVVMRRFEEVTVLLPGELGIARSCFWALARSVDRFSVTSAEDAERLRSAYRLRKGALRVDHVVPYPLVAPYSRISGCPPGGRPAAGLYQPGPDHALTLVELPATTPAQRARARARALRSSLRARARITARATPGGRQTAN